ncbi:MAG: sulfotransferase domain-containing protein [Pseudomonadota bacterium]
MIIINAGIPRSGTVLVNAILRQILKLSGAAVSQANPHGDELPQLIRNIQRAGKDRHRAVVVHTHTWHSDATTLLANSPFVTGFINYRDPRDVCVSLMRLHDHDLEAAATMTTNSFTQFETTIAALDLMVIPYELLVREPSAHIFQIGRRLGLWLGMEDVAHIQDETSSEKHEAIMKKVQSGELDNLKKRSNRNRVLVEDTRSLINDRHIQSGASGRWRTELDEVEQAHVNEVFAPLLERFGYAVDP